MPDEPKKPGKRVKRNWHPDFIEYTKFIEGHPTYSRMPEPRKKDGTIRWVVTAKSSVGSARRQWWERKAEELGISKGKGWMAEVARAIHPTKKKPCQVCGRVLSVYYIYPRAALLKKVLEKFPGFVPSEFEDIPTLLQNLYREYGDMTFDNFREILNLPPTLENTVEAYIDYILKNRITFLSPGVMCDAPDRFNGFHTYNICCRSVQDTGRHIENLRRYGEDRRAYELWNDGDWKAAAWLMQEFRKEGLSPDHIGPISLGFRPILQGMKTVKENIDKRNRLRYSDALNLIKREKDGEVVACWYAKPLWDKLKLKIKNDDDGERVTNLMRRNVHFVLTMLAKIKEAGFSEFLVHSFLHPEYAYYSISFKNFDPKTGTYEIQKQKGDIKQYENSAHRYIRKSLEALDHYSSKENRRIPKWRNASVDTSLGEVVDSLSKKDDKQALEIIHKIIEIFAEELASEFG